MTSMSDIEQAEPGDATQLVGEYGPFRPELTNVPPLQRSLDRITADVSRWNQGQWCRLNGDDGADQLTVAHLDAGVYHDFVLEPETIEHLRGEVYDGSNRICTPNYGLPIADCGTAFCLAGDIAVSNGYTFLAEANSPISATVTKKDAVNRALRGERVRTEYPSDVGRWILNVTGEMGSMLWRGDNTFIELWGLGQLLTAGRLTLPDSLPATYTREGNDDNDTVLTVAQETPDEVRSAVNYMTAYAAYRGPAMTHWLRTVVGSAFDVDMFWHVHNDEPDRIGGFAPELRTNDVVNANDVYHYNAREVRRRDALADFVRRATEA